MHLFCLDRLCKLREIREECHITRRADVCVGVTQFWVCQQVIDWIKEDEKLDVTELQRRLKDSHKILVSYRRVSLGKQLAMD